MNVVVTEPAQRIEQLEALPKIRAYRRGHRNRTNVFPALYHPEMMFSSQANDWA